MNEILFSRCNYNKIPAYRIRTTIERAEGALWVYKRALTHDAAQTLSATLAHETLLAAYIGDQIEVVCGNQMEPGVVCYPFVDAPTLQYWLCEYVSTQQLDQAYMLLEQTVQWIGQLPGSMCAPEQLTSLSDVYHDSLTTAFPDPVHCLDLGLLDLTADNLLYKPVTQDRFLIDAELIIESPIPLEVVIFRFVFFALAKLSHIFDTIAETTPLKLVANKLLRAPAAWAVDQWMPAHRVDTLLQLEEQLQYTFTGVLRPWPRPTYVTLEDVNERNLPTIAVRNEQQNKFIDRLQQHAQDQEQALRRVHHDFDSYIAASERELTAYKSELVTAEERLAAYVHASEQAITDYQHEVQRTRNEFNTYIAASEQAITDYQHEVQRTRNEFNTYIAAGERELGNYKHELAAAEERMALYVHASEQAITDYQRELQRVESSSITQLLEVRRATRMRERTARLTDQEQHNTMFWLSDQLEALRLQQPVLPASLTRRTRQALARRAHTLRTNPRGVVRRARQVAVRMRHRVRTKPVQFFAPATPTQPTETPPFVAFSSSRGYQWPDPLLSIVVTVDTLKVPIETVITQLRQQSFSLFEVVLYNRATQQAWVYEHADQPWRVACDNDLGATLLGSHALVLPPTGADFPPTYLEMNVLALATQELDFTINATGSRSAIEQALATQRLPYGNEALVFARAELLGDNLQLDVNRLVPRTYSPFVAARVIQHDTLNTMPTVHAWNDTASYGMWETIVQWPYLIVRPHGHQGWGQVPMVLRTADSVLPCTHRPSNKPRMLVVFPFIAVGGAEQLALDVLDQLRSQYDIICVTVEEKAEEFGSMVATYQQLFPHVYVLPTVVPSHLFFSIFTYLIHSFSVQTLFVANGASWIYDATGGLRATFPDLHMVNQVYDHRIGWIARYDPTLVHAYDRHIAPNQKIANAYQQRGVAADRIDIIYHGIHTSKFVPEQASDTNRAALREKFGLPVDHPVVTFAARMHQQKRPFDFVNVAQRFSPNEASFLMVGDGPLAEELTTQLTKLNLPHVHRMVFHTPFSDILAVSDVMVICSEYEGLPLVLLNAQSMGRAVVATDVGAIREVLDYTGGGIVVDAIGDVAALEQGVRRLLAAQPDDHVMHERMVERFDIQHVSQLYGQSLTPRRS